MHIPNLIILYVGAGSYIGKVICQALARDGATVIAADKNFGATIKTVDFFRDNDKEILSKAPHCPLFVNVTNRQSIVSAFEYIITQYKAPPSIIVNSADILRSDPIMTLSEMKFDDVMKVNLKGTFLVMQIAANVMQENSYYLPQDLSIINVGSIFGKLGCLGNSNYSASKAGVVALTKSAAIEFAKLLPPIRVNAVLPGFIHTPMRILMTDTSLEMCETRVTFSRRGYPDELANVIAFLASERSSYIHGACIEVTGGIR